LRWHNSPDSIEVPSYGTRLWAGFYLLKKKEKKEHLGLEPVPQVLALFGLLLVAGALGPVLLRAVVEQLLIHLHEQLQRVVDQSVYRSVG